MFHRNFWDGSYVGDDESPARHSELVSASDAIARKGHCQDSSSVPPLDIPYQISCILPNRMARSMGASHFGVKLEHYLVVALGL
jgi:hypothetical protein